MDPVTIIATVISLSGVVLKSYQHISGFFSQVRQAPKELEAIQSRSGNISSIVLRLKEALEENSTRDVIKKDELALKHVSGLDESLKAVQATLDQVAEKLLKEYRPASDGFTYKVRVQYYFNRSGWEALQNRLRDHSDVLSASMQGLNTLHVLRILGQSTQPYKDPAETLRTYATSILESSNEETHVSRQTPSPLPTTSNDPPSSLPFNERRRLAKKKSHLQRELLRAAKSGAHLDVSIILEEGAETDWVEDDEGMTALHFAAQFGHLRTAEILLDAGADIEAKCDAFGDEWVVRSEKGRTPLVWAAAGRDCPRIQERMCKLLLDRGADPNARNISWRTALQEAAMSVRYHNIDPRPTIQLLLKHGAFVNASDKEGWTPLSECGLRGKSEIADILLAHGAHVDATPGPDDPASSTNPDLKGQHTRTPLVLCGEWSWNEDLIVMLIERGADLEAKNWNGQTMAELAHETGRERVIRTIESVSRNRRS